MKKTNYSIILIMYSMLFYILHFLNLTKKFLSPKIINYNLITVFIFLIIATYLLLTEEKIKTKKEIDKKYNFYSLILFVPFLALFFIGDATLDTKVIKNKSTSLTFAQVEDDNKNIGNYDLEKIDLTIKDYNYVEASLEINNNPKNWYGKTVNIRGFVVREASYIPIGYFAIGKYYITCCAADATLVGFTVKADNTMRVEDSGYYDIKGVFVKAKNQKGEDAIAIKAIKIEKVKEEERQVYDCFAYGTSNEYCGVIDKLVKKEG